MAAVQSLGGFRRSDHPTARRWLQGVVAGLALFATAGGVVTLVAPPPGQVVATSAAQVAPATAFVVLAATCALVATGTIAWFGRSQRGLALIALCAAAAWSAMEVEHSVSVTREARSVSMVLAPFFAPLVVHLPLRALGADRGRGLAVPLVAFYAAIAVTSIGVALSYDPFFEVYCAPTCSSGDNVFLIWQDARLAATFRSLGLVISVVGSLGLAVWGIARIGRRPTVPRKAADLVVIGSVVLGASLTWWYASQLVHVRYVPADLSVLLPAIFAGGAVILLASAIVRLVAAEMRRAEALRRLAAAIGSGAMTASLRDTLARTLDDERLRVVYPMDDGGMIDDRGFPAEAPRPDEGRAVTTIVRGDRRIAVVGHEAGVDPEILDREIGAAARLAVDNERLEATIRARLRELQASRARIVEAADLARGRLERDLHDGAQQRLLAVSFELRLAAAALAREEAAADAAVGLETSIAELDRALAELRELAHGIHPVVLSEDGLSGALASLADTAEVPVAISGEEVGRCAGPTELAGYLVVVEVVRLAEETGARGVDVTVEATDGHIVLHVNGPRPSGERWLRLEDRVGAAGGRLTTATADGGAVRIEVELPCA